MTVGSATNCVLFAHSWPCLHQWLETRPSRQVCPVCKAAISRDKVIPLYGRGNTKQEDPRNKVLYNVFIITYSARVCVVQ